VKKTKPNLILVHSFPTNSILLKGLIEFLDDFFTVHFIDLPGFHKKSPPFKGHITIQRFSDYVDQKIKEWDFDEYIIGGASFGFLVVNNAKLNKKCRAVLAMEPYINIHCIHTSFWKQKQYSAITSFLKLIRTLHLEDKIWRSKMFSDFLQKEADYPKKRIDVIIRHIDPRTFFTITSILMNYKKNPKFHDLPHFLIGNFADRSIDFEAVIEVFVKNLDELHIASEPIDHYPKELTKRYFKSRIPHEHINRLLACIEGGE